MSDKEQNYDLDDELLSAYLDGELSAEDHAAVEARLAADPAAQHLLHELRSVSQSVQALPQEKLGRDVGEAVIRRAREAKPMASAAADAKAMPNFTIFSTTRAWIWASLALAAGLLIMIVQSGNDSADKMPPLAQRDERAGANQPADKFEARGRRELVISEEPKSPPPATIAADIPAKEKIAAPAASMPSQSTTEIRDNKKSGTAAGPPIAAAAPALKKDAFNFRTNGKPALAPAPVDQASTAKPAALPQPAGRASAVGGGLSALAGGEKSELAVREQPLFVVRVVATREALKNKSFDQLLASHKITVEPQPPKEQPTALSAGRLEDQVESDLAVKQRVDKAAERPDIDAVLVEAPAPAILSCLAGLNKNADDYLGIEVHAEPQPHDRAAATSSYAKKLADDLSKYSRGIVPQRQKGSRRGYDDYDRVDLDSLGERAPSGPARGNRFGVEAGGQHEKASGETSNPKPPQPEGLGRARRVNVSNSERVPSDELRASSRAFGGKPQAEAMKSPAPERKLDESEKSGDANELWKVLFVLSPEDVAVPSAPPANRPK